MTTTIKLKTTTVMTALSAFFLLSLWSASLCLQLSMMPYHPDYHQQHQHHHHNPQGLLLDGGIPHRSLRSKDDDQPQQQQQQQQQRQQETSANANTNTILSSTSGPNITAAAAAATRSHARVLMGIFTMDNPEQRRYRGKFRQLFRFAAKTGDRRICSLPYYIQLYQNQTIDSNIDLNNKNNCQLIYTFVVGANPYGPTERILQENTATINESFWLVPHPTPYGQTHDINSPDITLLNIQENMNDGKSQTWFSYAAHMAESYDMEYVAKADTDSILMLDDYFDFAQNHLLPPPYHSRPILAGSVVDKWWWSPELETSPEYKIKERFYTKKYGKDLHLYVQGQWYLMSLDLAKTVRYEAGIIETAHKQAADSPTEEEARRLVKRATSYLEHHEDHDISSMAFRSNQPIHLIIIALEERFWKHPVKIQGGTTRWQAAWDLEFHRQFEKQQQQQTNGTTTTSNTTLATATTSATATATAITATATTTMATIATSATETTSEVTSANI